MKKKIKIFLLILISIFLLLYITAITLYKSYKVTNYSMFPNVKINEIITISRFENEIFYGDIVVYPRDNKLFFGRIIGFEGDIIKFNKGVIYLNDKKIDDKYINSFMDYNGVLDFEGKPQNKKIELKKYLETLPNGVSYNIIKMNDDLYKDIEYKVPNNFIFIMCDNRDLCIDSRIVGYIKMQGIRKVIDK